MGAPNLNHVLDTVSPVPSLDKKHGKIGTGGWAYLPLEREDRLRAYAELFDYVEVNTTFYQMPRPATVRSWRRRVPPGFTFSVKCNRLATHRLGLTPVEKTFSVLDHMRLTLHLLRSDMLVLQTPPSLYVDEGKVREVSAILPSAGLSGIQVFWEDRSPKNRGHVKAVREVMLREGVVPVVDLSVEPPVAGAPVTYSRMFGAGAYDGDLLSKIYNRVKGGHSGTAVLTFHGSKMYIDALRYKTRFSR